MIPCTCSTVYELINQERLIRFWRLYKWGIKRSLRRDINFKVESFFQRTVVYCAVLWKTRLQQLRICCDLKACGATFSSDNLKYLFSVIMSMISCRSPQLVIIAEGSDVDLIGKLTASLLCSAECLLVTRSALTPSFVNTNPTYSSTRGSNSFWSWSGRSTLFQLAASHSCHLTLSCAATSVQGWRQNLIMRPLKWRHLTKWLLYQFTWHSPRSHPWSLLMDMPTTMLLSGNIPLSGKPQSSMAMTTEFWVWLSVRTALIFLP